MDQEPSDCSQETVTQRFRRTHNIPGSGPLTLEERSLYAKQTEEVLITDETAYDRLLLGLTKTVERNNEKSANTARSSTE
jgi:hypothetical protein